VGDERPQWSDALDVLDAMMEEEASLACWF
jgi:hypothetical protein